MEKFKRNLMKQNHSRTSQMFFDGNLLNNQKAALIISLSLILRVVLSVIIPLGFDEAYYGLYSTHLAWGYFDHPPLVAATAGIGRWLSGSYSSLSLRAGSILLFTLTSVVIYHSVKELFDSASAVIALVLLNTVPYLFLGIGAFVFPDNALTFFWSLFLFTIIKFQKSKNTRWLILAGIWAGFALLSKYHALFLLLGLFFSFILIKEWRPYFKNPYLYIGLLLSVVIFLPNILWNARHDWVSYSYQFTKAGGNSHFSFNLFLQGVLIQIGYLLPWHWFVLLGSLWVVYRKRMQEVYFLIPFMVLPIVVFTAIGATRQILPHWPMPGYLTAIYFAAGWINKWKPGFKKTYLYFSALMMFILAVLISIQATSGFLNLDKKTDLTLDGLGWNKVIKHLEDEKMIQDKSTFLFTDKWFTGGELAWAGENKYQITVLNSTAPHAFSFWTVPDSLVGKDGIYVSTDRYNDSPELLYNKYFKKIEYVENYTIYRSGQIAKRYYIWNCRNLLKPFAWPYGNR